MAENRLEFALGMSSADFMSALAGAKNAFLNLAAGLGIVTSAGAAFNAVWSQITRGAALHDLSKRTGESAESLFKLQRGFTLAGISAESVPRVLYQLQKALGGVNDMGESTKDIFAALGLDVNALKGMSGADAIATVTGALGRLDRASASLAASKIFGRMGAQDMLQLARNSADFAEGMERAAESARIMGQQSGAFDKLMDSIQILKDKISDLFIKGAVPVSNLALSIIGAFEQAKLDELVELSIKAGIYAAFSSGRVIMAQLWQGMFELSTAKTTGDAWKQGAGAARNITQFGPIGGVLKTFWDMAGLGGPAKAGLMGTGNIWFERLQKSLERARGADELPRLNLEPIGLNGLGDFGDKSTRSRRGGSDFSANALERIGFMFGNQGKFASDDRLVRNSDRTLQVLQNIHRAILDRRNWNDVPGPFLNA